MKTCQYIGALRAVLLFAAFSFTVLTFGAVVAGRVLESGH